MVERRDDHQSVITGQTDLRRAYQDGQVAREYVGRRFESPLGSLLHRRQVDVVASVIAKQGVRRAVEIAPGPARVSVDVLSGLESAVLIDASAQMLSEAARRLRERGVRTPVHLVQADAFQLPLVDRHDLVYSFRLIRHFERSDRLRLYAQIRSLLKPGGWLVFDAVNTVVSAPLRAKAAPGEYAHYDALLTPGEIRDELREAGFDTVGLEGVQYRFGLLQQIQYLVAPRSDGLARGLMAIVDKTGGPPLEWVVTCRRA